MTIVSEQYDDYILVYDYDSEPRIGVQLSLEADSEEIAVAAAELAEISKLEYATKHRPNLRDS